MTTKYEPFFSRAGHAMRESAIRKMGAVLAQAHDMISFAPGYPAEDVFPWEAFAEIARELLSGNDGSVLQYGPTRGYKPLRDAIVTLMAERHITASVGRLVVTTGSQQGLDLIGRVLFDPGDVVLVELPSYTGAISAFRAVGASLVGVRQDPDGIDLDELDETLVRVRAEGRRVKALYVVPNFQNPTGLLMGTAKRPRILEWAERRDVLVIEDDPYRDLYFPDVAREADTRPIAADDTNGRVIYLSSFSKTLAPGFRVAWLHAPEPIAAKLELAKQAEDLCSGGLDQRVVYEACQRGILAKNLPKLRSHYAQKRDVMVKALRRHLDGHLTWPDPRGGFFLWAKLTGTLQTDALLERARERGVIFVAGSAFFVDGAGAQHLRLSFSAPPPDRIEEGVARLAAAVSDALAAGTAEAKAGR
ncbi:MAG TPA: PLP-dependent aminotransferase family protein [Vicinamibacterales bacterium]|nr:PLP-dependent aminotransferase family protein [Vicinamibacterales bacterium]